VVCPRTIFRTSTTVRRRETGFLDETSIGLKYKHLLQQNGENRTEEELQNEAYACLSGLFTLLLGSERRFEEDAAFELHSSPDALD
jgi:hypothetical protein